MELPSKNEEQKPEGDKPVRRAGYDYDSYRYLDVQTASEYAALNGLVVHVKKRNGKFLCDPSGYDPKRVNFTVMDNIVTGVSFG
jgi:hypothetical protein